MNQDDEEEPSLDAYDYPRIVKEYDDAWKRIKTPSVHTVGAVPQDLVRRGRTLEVLTAAHQLYQPGDIASPTEIARKIGSTRFVVSRLIYRLNSCGKWPFRMGRLGMKYRKKGGLYVACSQHNATGTREDDPEINHHKAETPWSTSVETQCRSDAGGETVC